MTLAERFQNLGRLIGDRIELVQPSFDLADAVYRACRESSDQLRTFLPWMHEELQLGDVQHFVRHATDARANGTALNFWIIDREDRRCLGGVVLRNFGLTRSQAELGYWIRTGYTDRGYAAEAVTVLLKAARKYLALDRVDAIAAAENIGSHDVLKRCGFVESHRRSHRKLSSDRLSDVGVKTKTFGRKLHEVEIDDI